MPKMKTHSGVKKRFRKNGAGKIKAEGARRGTPHKLSNRNRRDARRGTFLKGGMAKRIKRMLVAA
jgi:large subunit ribosomal protein L35